MGASAEQRAEIEAGARDSIAGFAKVLSAHGMSHGDVTDAVALAFVMCYAALRDEDPGVKRLALLRDQLRAQWLSSPILQSHTDEERQASALMPGFRSRTGASPILRMPTPRHSLRAIALQRVPREASPTFR